MRPLPEGVRRWRDTWRRGAKHALGLWIEPTEGAKFWLKVMNALKTRGLGDILIAVVDRLKGFPTTRGLRCCASPLCGVGRSTPP